MIRHAAAAALLWSMAAVTLAQTADDDVDAWSLLINRFELVSCSPGDAFHQVARQYAKYPDSLQRMLQRAEPWVAYLATEIIARDLPGELALLPMVESGFDAFAHSRREAAGSWQLLESTARLQGVEISSEYDGRRDMLAATPAALDYLETHFRHLGDWALAIHAYNAGRTRIRRLLNEHDGPEPHAILPALPGETRFHFKRLMGLACLFRHPREHGLRLPVVPMQPSFAVIELDTGVDLATVAIGTGLGPRVLVELNAGLKGTATPQAGPHRLLVPHRSKERVRSVVDEIASGSGPDRTVAVERARQALDRLQDELLPERHYHHRVRPGDTLWVLSQRYSVPASAIRRSNGLDASARLRPGHLIRIPPGNRGLLPHQYRVQPGDSLWSIARDHGMSVAELVEMNAMTAKTPLLPGKVLSVGNDACCDEVFQLLNP